MNHRRKSSRKRKQTRLALLLFLLLGLSVAVWQWALSPSVTSTSQWADVNRVFDAAEEFDNSNDAGGRADVRSAIETNRTIYPYSVVPGGARSAQELRESSAHDPVVAAHYAGFDFNKAHLVTLHQPRLVYLSYRIGDKIYWTTKQVSLRKGETLITDGKITGRTRCANQISALPQKITFPQEPAIEELNKPLGSSTQIPFPDNFRSALESRPHSSGLGAAGPPALSTSSLSPLPGGGFLPLGSPSAPGGSGPGGGGGGTTPGGPGSGGPGSGGPGSGGPGPGGPGPTPPASVPEPSTVALVLAESLAAAFCLAAAARNKSNTVSKVRVSKCSSLRNT